MKNEYRIEGERAIITLHGGHLCQIDAADIAIVEPYLRWHASRMRSTFYVSASLPRSTRQISMHRLILDAKPGQQVDHKDRDGLNNTRANLRIATFAENNRNRAISRANSSGVKGVYWNKALEKWHAQITVDNEKIHLGYYAAIADAADAYAAAALKYHGDFARVA